MSRPLGGQSGNIMLALFAAIGAVGVVGASSMAIMKGPVRGMHNVTQKTIAENNMIASGKLAVMAAGSQPSGGDCDADGAVEPVAWSNTGAGPKPTGGGYLPSNIGASLQDPWGNIYGYCVWDHGTAIQTGCATPTQRLRGEADKSGPVIAVMSSGPDRTFQTSCGNAPAYVTKVSGSDDIVLTYTYDEATALSAGLWTLKSSDQNTAEIKKNLEVKNAADAVVFGVDSTSDISKPSIKVDYIKALANTKVEFLSSLLASTGFEKANGGRGYYGWGNVARADMAVNDLDHSRASTYSVYRINEHTGLSLSAHSNYGGIRFYNQGYSATDPYASYLPANGAVMAMAITDGNVGIGRTDPSYRLDVKGAARIDYHFAGPGLTFSNRGDLTWYPNIADDWEIYPHGIAAGSAASRFSIVKRNRTTNAATSLLSILNNGNVGIWTGDPVSRLHVVTDGTEMTSGYAKVATLAAHHPTLQFKSTNGTNKSAFIGIDGAPSTEAMHFWTGNLGDDNGGTFAARMSILANGNVGMGTVVPRAKLDVNGQIVGGFGAVTTSGVNDWNDISNTRPGNGYTLLRPTPSSANGPPAGNYFHSLNFEYSTKDGSGQITQLAIPYADTGSIPHGIWIRGRYSGSWTAWTKVGDSSGGSPPGTLCGMRSHSSEYGSPLLAYCNGYDPGSSCPSGYTRISIPVIGGCCGQSFSTCAKN